MKMQFLATVHQDRQDGPFGVSFPHAPGCAAVGDTLEKALAEAAEALTSHLQVCLDHGDLLPEPQRFILAQEFCLDGLVLLTHVEAVRPSPVVQVPD